MAISSCSKETEEIPKSLNEKLNFSSSEYSRNFKNQLTSIDGYIIQQDSILQFYDTLKYFYSSRDFQPLFINSFEDNEVVYSLISVIEKANEHGLNPEQYHFSQIINEFSQATDTLPNESRYYHLAFTELLVSDALLKYSHNLRYGILNPKNILPDSYFLPYDDSSKGDLFQPLREENVVQYLESIQPKSKRYDELKIALKYYNRFKDIDWSPIPIPATKLEVGSKIRQSL